MFADQLKLCRPSAVKQPIAKPLNSLLWWIMMSRHRAEVSSSTGFHSQQVNYSVKSLLYIRTHLQSILKQTSTEKILFICCWLLERRPFRLLSPSSTLCLFSPPPPFAWHNALIFLPRVSRVRVELRISGLISTCINFRAQATFFFSPGKAKGMHGALC